MTGAAAALPDAALARVLKPQPGVCRVCRQWAEGRPTCWACNSLTEQLSLSPVTVLPLALAIKGGPLASALWRYKAAELTDAERARSADALVGVLSRMAAHEQCLRQEADLQPFECVTWVPSSRFREGKHPLEALLRATPSLAGRVIEGLRPRDFRVAPHQASARKFSAAPDLVGASVLLVDDTWTRGANALSALKALHLRGAAGAVLVIGRHFVPAYRDCRVYEQEALSEPFSAFWCACCDPRALADPPLPLRPRTSGQ
jgi:predicted amidophosphoribosyltransferase